MRSQTTIVLGEFVCEEEYWSTPVVEETEGEQSKDANGEPEQHDDAGHVRDGLADAAEAAADLQGQGKIPEKARAERVA